MIKESVFIVDGSGYIFRSYYAIPKLLSKNKTPINAVYGFCMMIQKLIKDYNPKYLAIAFDTGKKTFRHDICSNYKVQRPSPPDDLIPQFKLIDTFVDAFNIARFRQIGFEADDIIGSLAKRITCHNYPVVIVTDDKDLMQLVSNSVSLLCENKSEKKNIKRLVTPEYVEFKFGVRPRYIPDVLALIGDSSDNITGVDGIGKKNAAKLIMEYGHVEQILNSIDQIKQVSIRNKLIQGSDRVRLNKQLTTINCNIDIDFDLNTIKIKQPNVEKLKVLYLEFGFDKLLANLSFKTS